MKFGIIEISQPDREREEYPYREIHERVTKEIIEADQRGYDMCWIAEHHASTGYGILPDPLMYVAYLASQTKFFIKLKSDLLYKMKILRVLILKTPVLIVGNLTVGGTPFGSIRTSLVTFFSTFATGVGSNGRTPNLFIKFASLPAPGLIPIL